MLTPTSEFAPQKYRGFLLLLARSQWDAVLRDWGDPSDLVHVTLAEACAQQKTFRGDTPAAFAVWLRTIFTNNLRDLVRSLYRGKRDFRRKQSLEEAIAESSARLGFNLAINDPSPSKLAEKAEQLNRLSDALDQLPPDQQEAVRCHHLRGMSLEETAAQMQRTKPAVAGLLRNGLKRLRGQLGEGGER